jgi:hypothetical protein
VSTFASSGLLNAPSGLVIQPVPEPSTCMMALAGLACGSYSMLRRRSHGHGVSRAAADR